MLTRCPHCTTTFRVKPEQLKARLGRVRCGQCQTVFNALDSLVEEVAVVPLVQEMAAVESTVPEPSSAPAEAPEQTLPAEETIAPQPAHEAEPELEASDAAAPANEESPSPVAELPEHAEPEDQPVAIAEEIPPPLPEPESEQLAPLAHAAEPLAPELHANPEPVPAEGEELAPEGDTPATAEAPAEDASPATPTEADALDFTVTDSLAPAATEHVPLAPEPATAETQASPAAPSTIEAVAEPEPALPQPPRPPRRWPWAMLAVIASLMLLGQALFYYRVEVAVFAPVLKPLLKAACEPLGCEVPRPRKADLLDIESSDLHPGKTKGRLDLVAVLKNKAPFSQELPVLELSLTDTADRPLVIKALQPADYLPPGRKPTAGFPAKGEINVSLTLDAGDVPATGYRLYLYYP